MDGYRLERGMGEGLGVWLVAGGLLLVLCALVSRWLFVFGLGVAAGLAIAYEIAMRWLSCLL